MTCHSFIAFLFVLIDFLVYVNDFLDLDSIESMQGFQISYPPVKIATILEKFPEYHTLTVDTYFIEFAETKKRKIQAKFLKGIKKNAERLLIQIKITNKREIKITKSL